jgi:hypothetical protein
MPHVVRAGSLGIAVLAACVFTAAAVAAPPPKGSYGCSIGSSMQYAGQLFVLDGSHYRINKGKISTFVSKGAKLTFPSGPFHGSFKGRWFVDSSGRAEVALTSLSSGFETEYCERGT